MKNKCKYPTQYKNYKEMDKPISVLMKDLRNDLSTIRGKMFDITQSYGWDKRRAIIDELLFKACVAKEWKELQ